MKLKNMIILLLFLILLTGCTAKVDITINPDYLVDESINIIYNNSATTNYETPKKYAESYLEHYKPVINFKNYDYSVKEGLDTSTVTFTKSSKNICDSINNSLFSQYLYKFIKCEELDDYYEITSEGNQLINVPMNEKKFNVEAVELNLTLPVYAISNDADEINGKTYTWIYDSSTSTDKSIYVKIDKKQLKEAKITAETNKKRKEQVKLVIVLFVCLIFVAVLAYVCTIFYKKYKNNKLDY